MTTSEAMTEAVVAEPDERDERDAMAGVEQELIGRLVAQAREQGLDLAGEGGLLAQLTKRVLESALDGELTDHLGYDKHEVAAKTGSNTRNGHRAKTITTDVGPVEIDVPRDRDASFEPKIVAKRQRRLSGVDEMVLSLSAKGLTPRRDQRAPGRGVWGVGVQADHLHHHRLGDRGHGRMAEPAARSGAVSIGRCESGGHELMSPSSHELCWGAVIEAGTWPVVEFVGDVADLLVGGLAQVGSLGEVLPQEPVGVLVAAALPGRVRVGEVDADASGGLDAFVMEQLVALVPGQGPS
jgi:hypothetical protein